jgi:membrane-bound lytic murein transglycosylase B
MCESCHHETINVVAALGALAMTGRRTIRPQAQDDTTSAALPRTQDAAFQAYLQQAAKARAGRVRQHPTVMAGLTYNPRVISLDRAQPGGTPSSAAATPPDFTPYRPSHVDAAPIARGRAMHDAAGDAARIEARYGVPAPILLASGAMRPISALSGQFRSRPLAGHAGL